MFWLLEFSSYTELKCKDTNWQENWFWKLYWFSGTILLFLNCVISASIGRKVWIKIWLDSSFSFLPLQHCCWWQYHSSKGHFSKFKCETLKFETHPALLNKIRDSQSIWHAILLHMGQNCDGIWLRFLNNSSKILCSKNTTILATIVP
jgi:hypothetical protein